MHRGILRITKVAVEKVTSAGLIALMALLSFMVVPSSVSAADLNAESTALSNPTISQASVTYTHTQSSVSLSAIKCIKVLYSVNSDGTGGLPTGMSIAGATYNAAGSAYVPDVQTWTAAVVSNAVQITNATGETPASAGPDAIVLTGITNGSTKNVAYFATVSTYNNVNCSTSPIDSNGQSAFVFTESVIVDATVNPTLTFTVNSTTCSLGVLTISSTGSCSHTMTAASNATSGYAISYIASDTMTDAALDTITANGGTAVLNNDGVEQFGLNLVANASPVVGLTRSGDTGGNPTAQYNIADSFAFDIAGAIVATSTGTTDNTIFTVSYIANVASSTEAGLYTKTQTYNITATY